MIKGMAVGLAIISALTAMTFFALFVATYVVTSLVVTGIAITNFLLCLLLLDRE